MNFDTPDFWGIVDFSLGYNDIFEVSEWEDQVPQKIKKWLVCWVLSTPILRFSTSKKLSKIYIFGMIIDYEPIFFYFLFL